MFMFEKLCRLCLTDKSVSSTLNNSDSDNIILLDKLNRIAPGILKINSSLPIGICTTCIAQLNQACKFIKNCLRSQEILNKYLEQLQNGLDTEQGENYEIEIIAIKLEQNKTINYMNYMNIEQTDDEFLNTLVNYEEESGFIKQENIIEYNDESESIQVNFENDIIQEETNVKMEISEEECNYSIDTQSNINVKEELESLSEDIIDFKNEIIEEHLYETNIIDYECTEVKYEDEIKIEDHDSKISFVDIPTIMEQSDFCGFNLTEYSLANDIKVKYNFELNRLCDDMNKFLINFQNEKNNTSYSKNCKNDVVHLRNVCKALKRSSTRKVRQNSSKDRSDINVNIRTRTLRTSYMSKKARKFQSDVTRQICTNKRSYECKICGKGFNTPSNLTRHIRTHTGDKPFQCKTCKKAIARNDLLTTHIRTHTGEKPFHCQTCKKRFTRKGDLTRHIRTHSGEKPFHCQTCKKSFAQKINLTTHLRTHSGEKPFQCQTCKKTFADKINLKTHTRTHSGEKPFHCQTCKKSFAQKSNLTTHLQTHSGEKPFHCQTCKKSFAQKSNLTTHLLTHSGEKPFHCQTCKKSFSQKNSLKIHIRTHIAE